MPALIAERLSASQSNVGSIGISRRREGRGIGGCGFVGLTCVLGLRAASTSESRLKMFLFFVFVFHILEVTEPKSEILKAS